MSITPFRLTAALALVIGFGLPNWTSGPVPRLSLSGRFLGAADPGSGPPASPRSLVSPMPLPIPMAEVTAIPTRIMAEPAAP